MRFRKMPPLNWILGTPLGSGVGDLNQQDVQPALRLRDEAMSGVDSPYSNRGGQQWNRAMLDTVLGNLPDNDSSSTRSLSPVEQRGQQQRQRRQARPQSEFQQANPSHFGHGVDNNQTQSRPDNQNLYPNSDFVRPQLSQHHQSRNGSGGGAGISASGRGAATPNRSRPRNSQQESSQQRRSQSATQSTTLESPGIVDYSRYYSQERRGESWELPEILAERERLQRIEEIED
ncbi:hypothetical protein MIR68_005675 [Amoeboaphelidium protococcarum]|nr:hypothetical protein MIR68_005675 [Amoeboaphelidium protococcarum]